MSGKFEKKDEVDELDHIRQFVSGLDLTDIYNYVGSEKDDTVRAIIDELVVQAIKKGKSLVEAFKKPHTHEDIRLEQQRKRKD
ncbi:MAG TPA: hypothetical protein EYP21_06190 [Syntrophaceae bacterium]|nr:hypothetical protein [Syntrophaceae bacterium]